jgi:hypothetical protein
MLSTITWSKGFVIAREAPAGAPGALAGPSGVASIGCVVKKILITIHAMVTASAAMNITAPTARPDTR